MSQGSGRSDGITLKARYLAERDTRLRVEADIRHVAPIVNITRYLNDPYAPASQRAPVSKAVKFALIGCGFGGFQTPVELLKAEARVAG